MSELRKSPINRADQIFSQFALDFVDRERKFKMRDMVAKEIEMAEKRGAKEAMENLEYVKAMENG